MAVNDFNAKQSARYSRVLVVTELVLSGTQCIVLISVGCIKCHIIQQILGNGCWEPEFRHPDEQVTVEINMQ